jgi:hypothetical protein
MRNPTTADFQTEPQSFFFDQTGRFFGQRRRLYENSSVYGKIKVGPTTLARHTQGV